MKILKIDVWLWKSKYVGYSVYGQTADGRIIIGNHGAALPPQANSTLRKLADNLESTQASVSLDTEPD